MENSDESDYDPDDIFEELEPTEPESLDARIRAGNEVDTGELTYDDDVRADFDDCTTDQNYSNYLEEKKPEPPKPPEQP